ncbi:hypothetical protein [Streptomyces sp. NPDC051738]|uniref:hypothetical protein n=1 Tax=Streptomyces sp. NPDC051738 TaxID=3365672 RepID=UPI0037D6C5AC
MAERFRMNCHAHLFDLALLEGNYEAMVGADVLEAAQQPQGEGMARGRAERLLAEAQRTGKPKE